MCLTPTSPRGDPQMTFLVYNGEYPFDTVLGTVVAETPE